MESITWIFKIIFGMLSNIPSCIHFSLIICCFNFGHLPYYDLSLFSTNFRRESKRGLLAWGWGFSSVILSEQEHKLRQQFRFFPATLLTGISTALGLSDKKKSESLKNVQTCFSLSSFFFPRDTPCTLASTLEYSYYNQQRIAANVSLISASWVSVFCEFFVGGAHTLI